MPAHITLLYPFTDSDLLVSGRIAQVRHALASFGPFDGELDRVSRFQRPDDVVLWLAPREPEPFIAVTEALRNEFPAHPPYGGEFESIVPHLTVAVNGDPGVLASVEAELKDQLPISIRVEAIRAVRAHRPLVEAPNQDPTLGSASAEAIAVNDGMDLTRALVGPAASDRDGANPG